MAEGDIKVLKEVSGTYTEVLGILPRNMTLMGKHG